MANEEWLKQHEKECNVKRKRNYIHLTHPLIKFRKNFFYIFLYELPRTLKEAILLSNFRTFFNQSYVIYEIMLKTMPAGSLRHQLSKVT